MASGNNYSTESDEKKKDIGLRKKSVIEPSSSDDSSDEDLDELNIKVHPPKTFLTLMWNWAADVLTYMSMMVIFHQSTAVQDEDSRLDIQTHGDHEQDNLLNQSSTQPVNQVENAEASNLECCGINQSYPTENVPMTSNILKTDSNPCISNTVSTDPGRMERSKKVTKVYSNPLVTNNLVQPNERNSTLDPTHDKVYDVDRPPDDKELLRVSMVGDDNGQVTEEHQPVEGNVEENCSNSNSLMTPASSNCAKTKATDLSTGIDCQGKRSDIQLKNTAVPTARDEETRAGSENVKQHNEKSKREDGNRAPVPSPSNGGQDKQQHGIVDQLGQNPISSTKSTEEDIGSLIWPADTEGRVLPRTNTATVQESSLTTETPVEGASNTPQDLTTCFAYKQPEKENSNPIDKIESLLVDQTQEQSTCIGKSVADKRFDTSSKLEIHVLTESGDEDYIETNSDDEHFPAPANEDSNIRLATNFDREIDHESVLTPAHGTMTSNVTTEDELASTSASCKQEKEIGSHKEKISFIDLTHEEENRTEAYVVDTHSIVGTTFERENVDKQVPEINQENTVLGTQFNHKPIALTESNEGFLETRSSVEYFTNEDSKKPLTTDEETVYALAISQIPDQSVETTFDNELATKHAAFAQPEKQSSPTCTGITAADTNLGSSTKVENYQAVHEVPQTNEENTVMNIHLNIDHILPNGDNEETRAANLVTSESLDEITTQVPHWADTDKIADGESLASTHYKLVAFKSIVGTYENTSMHQNKTESTTVDRMQGQDASNETNSLNANESNISEKQMPRENPVGNATISNKNDKVTKEGQNLQENSTCDDDIPRAQKTQAVLPPREVEITLMTSDVVNSDRTEIKSNEQLEGAIKEEKCINKRAIVIDEKAKPRRPKLESQN